MNDVLAQVERVVARIVPGAESSGFVAPIIDRTVATAPSPSIAIATTGPEVMNSTSSG